MALLSRHLLAVAATGAMIGLTAPQAALAADLPGAADMAAQLKKANAEKAEKARKQDDRNKAAARKAVKAKKEDSDSNSSSDSSSSDTTSGPGNN
ncbi:hypothetical protein [Insolitispirillum peregrinum]|uniref:hypothetical protein n=1 Tax=Insolitispirillum peregrinum TaxID=80876 RepID=UPI00360841E5